MGITPSSDNRSLPDSRHPLQHSAVRLGPISAPSWKSSALASPTVAVRPIAACRSNRTNVRPAFHCGSLRDLEAGTANETDRGICRFHIAPPDARSRLQQSRSNQFARATRPNHAPVVAEADYPPPSSRKNQCPGLPARGVELPNGFDTSFGK